MPFRSQNPYNFFKKLLISSVNIFLVLGFTFLLIESAGSVDQKDNSLNKTENSGRAKRGYGNLWKSPGCEDLKYFCPHLKPNTDDLDVIICINTNKEQNNVESLSDSCHNNMRAFMDNFLKETELKKASKVYCTMDSQKIQDCYQKDGTSSYLMCLYEKVGDLQGKKCTDFIQRLKLLTFLDVRTMKLFLDVCNMDIDRFQCQGQGGKDDDKTGEGTLGCLQEKVENLERDCRDMVLMLSEVQAEDVKFDRQLFLRCTAERISFCPAAPLTGPSVYSCLMEHRLKASQQCGQELLRHEQMIVEDYQVSRGLVKVCKEDIRQYHCRKAVSQHREIRLAQILLCLENATRNGTGVSKDCSNEMLTHRRILMEDYRLSPELVAKCSEDIAKLCRGLETGGRTIHCLMEHARARKRKDRISNECTRELETLIKEVDIGEDWRVDPMIRKACQNVVSVGCSNARGGRGRVMSCLMERLGTEMMSDECETALLQVQYFVARDYKLDTQLYQACREDAVKQCHAKRAWADGPGIMDPERGPFVLPCLYRLTMTSADKKKLKKNCEVEVLRVMRQRALSVQLQPEVERACLDDLAAICNEKTGPGEELLCLQDKLEQLSSKCKSVVSNYTEIQSIHLEMNPIILSNCRIIMEQLCQGEMNTGNGGDVLDCLIEHKNDASMRTQMKCRAAVEHHQLISLKDYHFTFRFKEACSIFVSRYCPHASNKQEVVTCLSEVVRNDTLDEERAHIPKDCRHQLRAQLLQARENIDLDPKLKQACAKDIQTLCPRVPHGNAKVLECLEIRRRNLSNECHKKIFNVEKQDLADSSTDYILLNTCRAMILKYCRNYNPSQALQCLKKFKYEPDFQWECRMVVIQRMMEEASDYRLNPDLQRECRLDISKFCTGVMAGLQDKSQLEGKVIRCLKIKFKESRLSSQCERQLGLVLKEAALNYQLNPVLSMLCSSEIKKLCTKDENTDNIGEGRTEECLKKALLEGQITSKPCKLELVELINERRADIQADPILYRACSIDINRHCFNVDKGNSRLLDCLLAYLHNEVRTKPLKPECKTMLSQRMEMYKLEPQRPVETVSELYVQVSNSPARRYFMVMAFTFIGMTFIMGLFCGRVTRRSVIIKNK